MDEGETTSGGGGGGEPPGGNSEHPQRTPPLPAKKTADDFIFGKLLGEGSFSSVYLAKDVKSNKECAIKVCEKQHIIKERKAESIRREKEVLTILSANRCPQCPFFVHLYATFQDSQRLYFVMTYASGGELLKHLHNSPFPITCSRFYSAEILLAVRHLHKIGIVHRDLKPENILLTDSGHILVTDFGSAKILDRQPPPPPPAPPAGDAQPPPENNQRTRSNSFVGTAQYVSPEVLKGRYSEVGPPADLWAFGCILFQLISGQLPFQASNEFLIFQKILNMDYSFPENFAPEGRDLVEKLLVLEPSQRLGAGDTTLYQSLEEHQFFTGINWEKIHSETPPSPGGRKQSKSSGVPDYKPGFDPRAIAERVLRSEQDSIEESDDDDPEGEEESNNLEEVERSPVQSKFASIQLPSDDEERKERLEEQLRRNPKSHAAVKGNLILKQGLVNKKKGLFARKRLLLLTEGPHLFYCEPGSFQIKGEIPWSQQLRPEAKGFSYFLVHTPNRIYNLEDPQGFALEWVKAINEIHQHVYGMVQPPGGGSTLCQN